MKTFTKSLSILAMLSLCRSSHAQQAPELILNGGFETHNNPYHFVKDNVGGIGQAYDDLPNWSAVGAVCPYGSNTYKFYSFYIPTSESESSPPWYYVSPNSGWGCVSVSRETPKPDADGFVVQQLSQALIPGHFYRATFYTRRLPYAPIAEKMAMSLINSPTEPTHDCSSWLPTPAAAVISEPVADHVNWTKVTQILQVPLNSPANSTWWVGLGLDSYMGPIDNSLYTEGYGVTYGIDDVSLKEATPCDLELLPYEPLHFCTDQPSRLFRIRNVAANTPGISYEWDFFKEGANGVMVPYFSTTSNDPETKVRGSWFQPGNYSYRVRAKYTTATTTCYTAWAGDYTYNAIFTVDSSCTYSPADDGPSATPTPESEEAVPSTSMNAYPNPASESLTLPTDAEQVQLFNTIGKAVPVKYVTGTLDVRNLPEGIYYLSMRWHGKASKQLIQIKH